MTQRRRDPVRGVALALVVATAAFSAWFLLADPSATVRTAVTDGFYPLLGTSVAALAWAARRAATAERARRGWALFTLAVAARVVADTGWFWLEVVRHEQPFPSVTDGFYCASYALMFAGVWVLGAPRAGLDRRSLALDVGAVATGSFLLVWSLLLSHIVADAQPLAQQVLAVAYPVADALLVTVVAALLLRRPPWLPADGLVLLCVGLLGWAVADVVWTGISLGSEYAGGEWFDLLWLWAYVCFGLAAGRARRHAATGRTALPRARTEQVVPFAGLLLGQCVLAAKLVEVPFRSVGLPIVGATVLTLLVVLRQSAVRRDHAALLGRYHELATVDALTGLLRREALLDRAEAELARARSTGGTVAVLMIDLDHFKQINDEYGHAGGDAVLAAVARLCADVRHASDVVGRMGGDELVALLPGLDEAGARAVADRLVGAVAASPTPLHGRTIAASVSIGVSASDGTEPLHALLARADEALYRAKAAGRGRAAGATGSAGAAA